MSLHENVYVDALVSLVVNLALRAKSSKSVTIGRELLWPKNSVGDKWCGMNFEPKIGFAFTDYVL